MRPHRFPVEPLVEYLAPLDMKQIAERTGVGHAYLRHAWKRGLSSAQADQAAVGLHLHPCLIWPNWFDRDTFTAKELRAA